MKKLILQILLTISTTCSSFWLNIQNASAQVDMSLLTEVAKSCQKDTGSPEYYKQMGFADNIFESAVKSAISSESYFLDICIDARYRHSLLLSKFPWIASTGEMMPGYPGSVAVSLMAYSPQITSGYYINVLENSSLIDCIVSQDPSSNQCISSIIIFHDSKKVLDSQDTYICPSCVVAHDNVLSAKKMRGSFMQWFLNLDKPTRRKLMPILGNTREAQDNRTWMRYKGHEAVDKYNEIRRKVAQEEQERRRREVIGN